jgi:hypothetical protein
MFYLEMIDYVDGISQGFAGMSARFRDYGTMDLSAITNRGRAGCRISPNTPNLAADLILDRYPGGG